DVREGIGVTGYRGVGDAVAPAKRVACAAYEPLPQLGSHPIADGSVCDGRGAELSARGSGAPARGAALIAGHAAEVEDALEFVGGEDVPLARDLADGAAAGERFVHHLGGAVVADVLGERRRDAEAALHRLGATVRRFEAVDTALGEDVGGGGEQRDRL